MRKPIQTFVEMCSKTLPIREPIYEFGSFKVPGQEGFPDLRSFFPGKKYVGSDMRQGPGVDVILNLHDIKLPPASVGTILAMDTFEHVEYPRKAIEQINRTLHPKGMVIISSVMRFKIHNYPNDYWRFTPECFKSLLRPFPHSFVSYAGKNNFPHTVVGIGFKDVTPPLENFLAAFDNWQSKWKYPKGKLKDIIRYGIC